MVVPDLKCNTFSVSLGPPVSLSLLGTLPTVGPGRGGL